MLFKDDDAVYVVESRSGYTGLGVVVCLMFGSNYLVRVDWENRTRCILVHAKNLRHAAPKEKSNGRVR